MHLNNPPPYSYLDTKDPVEIAEKKKKRRPHALNRGSSNDVKQKLKHMSLREYIGTENFRFGPSLLTFGGKRDPNLNKPKPSGEEIYYSILDRVRKQGAKSEAAKNRAKTTGSIKISH